MRLYQDDDDDGRSRASELFRPIKAKWPNLPSHSNVIQPQNVTQLLERQRLELVGDE